MKANKKASSSSFRFPWMLSDLLHQDDKTHQALMRVFQGALQGKMDYSILSRKKYGGSWFRCFRRDANWNLGLKTGPSSAAADQMKTVPTSKTERYKGATLFSFIRRSGRDFPQFLSVVAVAQGVYLRLL
jgi:hypothetical protein